VEINKDATKRTYKARTDEEWKGFKAQVLARFDAVEVHLHYQINADTNTWLDLTCKSDFDATMHCVREKVLVAWTRVVSMEVKNVVSNDFFLTNGVLTLFQLQKPKVRNGKKEK